jgi:ABC-type phosphate transport system substrate-binding protein
MCHVGANWLADPFAKRRFRNAHGRHQEGHRHDGRRRHLPYPIYAKWAESYKKSTGNGLNTGGVVPIVNLDGVAPGQMKLTGPVVADIYLGKITKWNAPEIAALNPGVKLPAPNGS